jgi:hypothetical protein
MVKGWMCKQRGMRTGRALRDLPQDGNVLLQELWPVSARHLPIQDMEAFLHPARFMCPCRDCQSQKKALPFSNRPHEHILECNRILVGYVLEI